MTLRSHKHHSVQQDNINDMDICGPNWNEGKNSCNAYDKYQYFYSGSLLKESAPPPSQYIPSLYRCRNGYGQSKRTTTESPKEPEKYQHMSDDEQKQFMLQKNGNYTLALSNYKNMVLSVFKGNVYCHIWESRNKNHVSLNLDELAYMLKNKTVVQDITEQLLVPNVEKKFPNFPFEVQKNGNYALDLSEKKNMVLSLFKGNVYCHIWDNRNKNHVSLNLDELAYMLKNKTVVQDIMNQLLVSNVEKKSFNFPFVVQKNGGYALDLSGDKKMVLSLFKGNVYCHLWDNKNKKHVSLNSDELMCVLSNEADIEHITELLTSGAKQ